MAHIRTQVRRYLKTLLTVPAGAPVTVRRVTPYPKALAGSIDIAIVSEPASDIAMGGSQERLIMARIAVAARGDSEESEDRIDDLSTFVEKQIAGDPTLGGLVDAYEYRGAELGFNGAGDTAFGAAGLMFAFTVYTDRAIPDPD